MIIDGHTHLYAEAGYVEGLLKEYDRLGIDIACVSGLAPMFDLATNEEVERAFKAHPDRIIGFGFFRLGTDPVSKVDEFHERGFKGVKFTCPTHHYDDDRFLPVYGRIEELGMPTLFHMGIVTTRKGERYDVTSRWMRPIHLDRLAHLFPDLKMICSHLGMPYYEEAAEMPRFHENIYLDITGSTKGWRRTKKPSFFREMLWYDGAFERIIFGTDQHYRDAEWALKMDRELYAELGIPEDVQEKIFCGNMAEMLGLKV